MLSARRTALVRTTGRSLPSRFALPLTLVAAALVGACTAAGSAPTDRARTAESRPGDGRASVCINGPSVYGGAFDAAAVDAVLRLAPNCVRVNVRQDVWSSIDDPTPRGPLGRSLLGTYDALVDRYRAAGIDVYILVHSEAAGVGPDAVRGGDGLERYVRAFVSIASHFRGRVREYEVFNEPNNWIGPSDPALDARAFARVLARVYRAVRVEHPDWDVRLVSGALFAFHQADDNMTTAADYLEQTYREGIAHEGWEDIRWETGTYPLDGVGYHFYLGFERSDATRWRVRSFVDDVWSVVTRFEGGDTHKRIYVSEFGWQSDDTAAGDAAQARELVAGFEALRGDPRVEIAMWFNLQDHHEGPHLVRWGLYRLSGYGDRDARPARDAFASVVAGATYTPPPVDDGGAESRLDVRYPVDAGGWVTQCAPDGAAERVWQTGESGRDDGSRWADFRYPQQATSGCGEARGGRYPLVFRSLHAGSLGGTWVTACAGSGHVQRVYRVDAEVDGHPAAVYLYDEPNGACP